MQHAGAINAAFAARVSILTGPEGPMQRRV